MRHKLETLVYHDFETVFFIDIQTKRYQFILKQDDRMNVPSEGIFEQTNEQFASQYIVAEDQDHFLKEIAFDRIVSEVTRSGRHSFSYRMVNLDRQLFYRKLSFIFSEDRKGLIAAVTDETEDVLDRIEKNRDLWLKNECIRFVVQHMCENFIIANPETDEAITFVHDRQKMHPKNSWKEQIRWFSDNIVVPEEREDYQHYFELGSLIERIRENGGITRQPCTINYPDGRHDLIITNTLIADPELDEEKLYLFSSAQDVTLLRRARETGAKLLLKSQQDVMTGLYNRATAEKLIRESLYSGKPEGWNTFILIDVDYFKNFNDSYGHMLGDAVLQFMGDAMREVFRASDILCRWGGDEFVIFIPRLRDETSLHQRLEALQACMKKFMNNNDPMPITLSIGGVIARNQLTLNTLFAQADEALYVVKSQGRDGIVLDRFDPLYDMESIS